MNDFEPPPINDLVDTIEKCERLITYIDYEIVDLADGIAGNIDAYQQNIALLTGNSIIGVGKEIKKIQQKIGREIAKLQKKLDFAGYQLNTDNPEQERRIEELQAIPPDDFADINSGTNPTIIPLGDKPSGDTDKPIGDGFNPPIGNNTTWIDPNTCVIWLRDGEGNETPIGMDQACLDAKKPKPPEPPNGNGNNNQLCTGTDSFYPNRHQQYIDVWWGDYNDRIATMGRMITYNPDVYGAIESQKRFYKINQLDSTSYPADVNDLANITCADPINTVINIPYQRNSIEAISIYTQEGENLVRERFRGTKPLYSIMNYNTIESYYNSMGLPNIGNHRDLDLGFISFTPESPV